MAKVEITGLPSSSSVSDSDLVHIKSGSNDYKVTLKDFKNALNFGLTISDSQSLSGGQTSVTIGNGLTTGGASFYIEGKRLAKGIDYNVATNTEIILTSGANSGDIFTTYQLDPDADIRDFAVQVGPDIEFLEFEGAVDDRVSINEFWPGQGSGSGDWVYNPSRPKSDHNGGTVRSPTVPVSGNTLAQFLAGTGETDPGGNGCWEISDETVTTHHFGAGATSNDTAPLQAFASVDADSKHINSGNYTVDGQITFSGASNPTYGDVTIDASAATIAGDFADDAVLYFDAGSLVALPGLATDVSAGGHVLSFSSAPSLSPGDIVMLYDPTDFSWSGHRENYRAGEMQKVRRVSGSTVDIFGLLWDDYTAGTVDVYRIAGAKTTLTGGRLHVISPAAVDGVEGMKFCRSIDASLQNVSTDGSGDTGVAIKQCYNTTITSSQPRASEESGLTTRYGLKIQNSQKIYAQGDFYSQRHAVTVSGNDETGCIPNRELRFVGTFSNDPDAGRGATAFQVHGNAEAWSAEGVFNGGVTLGGNRGKIRGIIRRGQGSSGTAVYSSELVGMDFDLSGVEIEAYGDPATDDSATVNFGHNHDAFDSDTVKGGTVSLRGARFYVPDSTRITSIRNRGATPSTDIHFDLTGMTVLSAAAGADVVRFDKVSGDDIETVILRDLESGAYNEIGKFAGVNRVKGWSDQGSESISFTTSDSKKTAAVTLNRTAPKTPAVQLTVEGDSIGTDLPIATLVPDAVNSFFIKFGTADGSNFDTSDSRIVRWRATIDE